MAIEAKYLRPRLDRVTLRVDALAEFATAFEHRLTVVCAPAGYGKTTSTAAALDACGRRSAWYKLDLLDRDPLVFLAAMTRAVQRLHPDFGAALLQDLESELALDLPPQVFAARFCAECDRVVKTLGHVVLDDYHETVDAPLMNDVLDYLLENCPQTIRFVVLTRYEPMFRLEKLRLAGDLARIPRDILLFDAGQVTEVLRQHSGKHHEQNHVERLLTLTEGWPASIVLAAMSLRWLGLPSLETALGDPRLQGDIFSYLLEQVFQRQSATVQRFLLRTCCLDHIDNELAERLLGEHGASRHLHYLARNHVFTFEAGREGTYRYHNLLRDFLKQRFVQDEGEGAFRALQRDTAVALEACGELAAAIELLLAANEGELALAAIARGGESLLEHAPYQQLSHWVGSLVAHRQMGSPWALVISGVLSIRDDRFAQALRDLRTAESRLLESNSRRDIYQVLSILEWAEFWAGDSPACMATCRRALACAETDAERLHTHLSLVSAAVDLKQWQAFDSSLVDVDRFLMDSGSEEAARLHGLRAHAAYYQGDVRNARNLLQLCISEGRTAMHLAATHNMQGMVETALGEYDSAEDSLSRALQSANDLGHVLMLRMIEDSRACLTAAQGELRAALADLVSLGTGNQHGDPWLQAFVLCHQGTILRRQGDLGACITPTRLASEMAERGNDPYLATNLSCNLVFSEALLGLDHAGELKTIAEAAGRAGLAFVELKAKLFQAILAHTAGATTDAVALLEECLPRQLSLGHINLIAQELCPRPELASLVLRRHKSNGLGPPLIDALSRHWQFRAAAQTLRGLCASQVGTWIDLVEAGRQPSEQVSDPRSTDPREVTVPALKDLTPRERQVLALMAQDRSNDEIAGDLFISLATVKTHVNHILRKLGQTKRVGAVLEYQRLLRRSDDPALPSR